MKRVAVPLALVVGVVAGAALAGVAGSPPETPELPLVRTKEVEAAPVPTPASGIVLAWVPGGLPAGFAERVAAIPGLEATTVVLGDTIQLAGSVDAAGMPVDRPAPGYTIPLETIAIDCGTWAPLVPLGEADAVCDLAPDEGLLGSTSARLRRLGPGGMLTLAGGRQVRVAGVVDDEVVGAAELALPAAGAAAARVRTPRYLLASYRGERPEAAIRAAAQGAELRVRGPGETPWLRHGDAVLPQSLLKAQFGEFSARMRGSSRLQLDEAWTSGNLETVDLPVVGRVTCHRGIVPALRGALGEVEARGLVASVDRRAAGCWNPRPIAGTDQPSRHAWGAAFDLVPEPSKAVVEVFERWGFTWGGRWLGADPVHFEYVRPPKG